MEVPSMLQGESLKRLLQGIAIGVALTVIVGFNWFSYGFGWTLGGTAEKMALQRVDAALVDAHRGIGGDECGIDTLQGHFLGGAYTPVCVDECGIDTLQRGKSAPRSMPAAATTM